MSGHSKWHKIQHKKAVVDSKRSKLFGQFSHDIKIAARDGSDPDKNAALRDAIDRAKKGNFPQVNIDRLLHKNTDATTTVMYEGYGAGGVAILMSAETDNTNRTVTDMRIIMKKHGGSLGEPNSVRWKFEHQAQITVQVDDTVDTEMVELAAIDAGATDVVQKNSNTLLITIDPEKQNDLKESVTKVGGTILHEYITYTVPKDQQVRVNEKHSEQLAELLHALSEHEDVVEVYSDRAE